jgi:hypothetical protein
MAVDHDTMLGWLTRLKLIAIRDQLDTLPDEVARRLKTPDRKGAQGAEPSAHQIASDLRTRRDVPAWDVDRIIPLRELQSSNSFWRIACRTLEGRSANSHPAANSLDRVDDPAPGIRTERRDQKCAVIYRKTKGALRARCC